MSIQPDQTQEQPFEWFRRIHLLVRPLKTGRSPEPRVHGIGNSSLHGPADTESRHSHIRHEDGVSDAGISPARSAFPRFLSTAFPYPRTVTIRILLNPVSFFRYTNFAPLHETRLPDANNSSISRLLRRISALVRLLLIGYGEFLPALSTASAQYLSSGLGLHTGPEAESSVPLDPTRLIGPLHSIYSFYRPYAEQRRNTSVPVPCRPVIDSRCINHAPGPGTGAEVYVRTVPLVKAVHRVRPMVRLRSPPP